MFGRFLRAAEQQPADAPQQDLPGPALAPDPLLIGAVEIARAAAVEEAGDGPLAGGAVGEHVEAVMEGEGLAWHSFECLNPGYVGWRWTVTVALVPGAADVTVNEVLLLPGPGCILAPPWVPWSDRVRPGDLSVGDVLPTPADDPRLVPGLHGVDDLDGLGEQSPLHPGQWQIGLGRTRILSASGQDAAVLRWQRGETGPQAAMARHAALTCASCGFLVTIGGTLGQAFGVCANAFGAADGRVVSMDFGCGAHSEIVVEEAPALDEPSPDEPSPDEHLAATGDSLVPDDSDVPDALVEPDEQQHAAADPPVA
ncbi:MAG: DUF3027 domain-containing protein [Actinomycetales bacterium]